MRGQAQLVGGLHRRVRLIGWLPAACGIEAGESGAASLAGAAAVLAGGGPGGVREQLGRAEDAVVLLLNTEGATDPDAYRRILAEGPTGRAAVPGT